MLIHEACQKSSLTRKAVEYYMEQGLISPAIQENGYRDFSEDDIVRLKKISVLRRLEISVPAIHAILSGQSEKELREISEKKKAELSLLSEKQKLIQELSETQDWELAHRRLQQLEHKQSVLERLKTVFPGSYGRFVSLHFAPYLNHTIETVEQQEAFDTVLTFLDNARLSLPDELQEYLDETFSHFDETFAEKISAATDAAIRDPETYMAEHRKEIAHYLALKESEAYQATPAYRLEQALRQFTASSGYNDVFIPAMCRLSASYRHYHEKLQQANHVVNHSIKTSF